MSHLVRDARPEDAPTIMQLIRELAEYERLAHEVVGTETLLAQHLFDEPARARAFVAEVDDDVVGFALYFTTYSTFHTRPGLYLEDLYVRPEFRSRGLGVALLQTLAARALDEGFAKVEWVVLDWNTPAIEFYDALGATPNDDWKTYRLSGEALTTLARRT